MRTALLLISFLIFTAPVFSQVKNYTPAYVLGNSLNNPYDLIIGNDGNIHVADSYTTRIFDTSGKFIKEHHQPGRYNDFNSSTGIAQDSQGNTYTLTGWGNTVHKISQDGSVTPMFGVAGSEPGQFNNPKGIAVDKEGNIYIADTQNHRIQKFDPDGNLILMFGSFGAEQGQFNMPTQLAFDKDGKLYIADSNNYRIQVFTKDGVFLRLIGSSTNPEAIFYPSDVTVDHNGNIYVADIAQYQIKVFNPQGALIKRIGKKGSNDGEFISQLSLAVDGAGFIYVADLIEPSRIQKFSPDGTFLMGFGQTGTEGGLIDSPLIAASDDVGNFFVANSISGLVKKYDTNGMHLLTFGGKGNLPGKFEGFLIDMKMDSHGNVYVLSNDAKGGIQKFNARGEFISRFAPFATTGQSEPEAPAKPIYMAIDPAGFIYVADSLYLYKYNPAGSFVSRLSFINNETGAPINFADYPINGRVPYEFDNNGLLYIALIKGIKIYELNGKHVRDFVPLDRAWGITAVGIDFDMHNNMFVTEHGYMKKYDPATGTLLANSTYHSHLVNYLRSKISVNATGTKVYVSGYQKTVTCFTDGSEAGNSNANYITGTIFQDSNDNCIKDSADPGLAGIIVEAAPGPYYAITDKSGKYTLEVKEGKYSITQILPASVVGKKINVCDPVQEIEFTSLGNVSNGLNFSNQFILSPNLSVSVSSTRRRRCFDSTTKLTYTNNGFAPANNAKVYFQLPKEVELLSADKPYTRISNGTYVFDAGTVNPGQTSVITIQDKVVCGDESIRGLTVCTKAWITPGNNGPVAPPTAVATITGKCDFEKGMVRFVLRNTGQLDMDTRKVFKLYLDGQLSTVEEYKLAAGDSLVLWIPNGGKTARLEAEQPTGSGDNTLASATVEACRITATPAPVPYSTGFVNAMPTDDEEAEVSEECLPIIDSYDPNDKLVSPVGLTEENYTPTGAALKYKIRFQNTGTDVAYRVVVVDTLSENLDLSTLELGSTSHTARFEVSGKGKPVLTWTFDNIMLSDSTTNEPGSHGYIQFSIKPKADLAEKTAVENFADIFFDFNSPVRTNTTVNRIYDMPPVVVDAVKLTREEIIATPAISSFAPAAGKYGAEVILSGSKFSATASQNKVYFNGVAATVVSASETELKVLVPASATATGQLKVVTADGTATSTEFFEVYQPPVLSSFSPIEGVIGSTVTLQGQQLSPTLIQSIKLSNYTCEIISNTANALVVKVPNEAVTGSFSITTIGGETVSASKYVVWHQPEISSLSKTTDIVGATIQIHGENFSPTAERNTVLFGNVKAQVLQATNTQLTVQVPQGAASGFVTVETPGGKATSTTYFDVIPGPVFVAMAPAIGTVGTTVEITGSHFLALGVQDEVTFNGEKAQVLEASESVFKVQVPRGATTGKIKIKGIGGEAVSTIDFVVEALTPAQAIDVFPNPTSGNFTISFLHADFDVQDVKIYTPVGELVHTASLIKPRPEKLEVNMEAAKPGMYLLQIRTDRGIVIKKLSVL
ncbi:DUF7619 domain-containing protein [Pontibacter cellulosilyticus]|uniref:IPT/TIG domain-containing protein n=1 Tax=Pontibacter cellulosilyticus TaxID=1720253 RepID=A0A923SHX6_9BACT|nr:IPT/TIG domain-containing protein [Pontibacter cellulosilyticus]MBC5992017.1 IPT/TIG domain-containing protein [Pontibacter cellulosilyticus]